MKSKGRSASNHDRVSPVKRIELGEDNFIAKLILFCVLLTIAVVSLYSGFKALLNQQQGWQNIEITANETNCSADFVFQYELGRDGGNANQENRALVAAYSEACVKCYRLFTPAEAIEGVNNLHYISSHPGEEIAVDALLYGAFETMEQQGGSYLYLAPVYAEYRNMFFAGEEHLAEQYDPLKNPDMAEYFRQLCGYINSREHIRLELLGNNTVMLHISPEYAAFAEENSVESFIDFGWMKNAFIVDYMAELFSSMGYTAGSITSVDGFTRNLDNRNAYSFNLFDRKGDNAYKAAVLEYEGPMSIVFLRDYPLGQQDSGYYSYSDGQRRFFYIDPADGICKSAVPNIVACSESAGCAGLLMELLDGFIADNMDVSALPRGSIWFEDYRICSNNDSLLIGNVYQDETVKYTLG